MQGWAAYKDFQVLTHSDKARKSGRRLIADRRPNQLKLIEEFSLPIISTTPPFYYHAGGCQVIGDCLVVPAETGTGKSSVYGPKSRDNVTGSNVALAKGIRLLVNGAGGDSLYVQSGGTRPDESDHASFCVIRINLIDGNSADVDILSFGANPQPTTEPVVAPKFAIKFRF